MKVMSLGLRVRTYTQTELPIFPGLVLLCATAPLHPPEYLTPALTSPPLSFLISKQPP